MVFANTKNSANSTGMGISIGTQPPSGFTPCSLYSFIISCCSFCGSFLYRSCRAFNSGWMACIAVDDRIAFWFSGHNRTRTMIPNRINTHP